MPCYMFLINEILEKIMNEGYSLTNDEIIDKIIKEYLKGKKKEIDTCSEIENYLKELMKNENKWKSFLIWLEYEIKRKAEKEMEKTKIIEKKKKKKKKKKGKKEELVPYIA